MSDIDDRNLTLSDNEPDLMPAQIIVILWERKPQVLNPDHVVEVPIDRVNERVRITAVERLAATVLGIAVVGLLLSDGRPEVVQPTIALVLVVLAALVKVAWVNRR